MTEPTEDVEVASVEPDGPDLATERFTSGGEGPEGQPDTVVEHPDTVASDPETPETAPEPVADGEPDAETAQPDTETPVETPDEAPQG